MTMAKEIIFPEYIGESEEALVLVLPELKEELSDIFIKFHAGEELDYWFSWNLVHIETDEYLVLLDIDWKDELGIVVGFTTEMWEVFRKVTLKKHLLLMSDWEFMMRGRNANWVDEEKFKPYALLIRNITRGMGNLLEQAEKLEKNETDKEVANYLYEVLGKFIRQKYLLH